MATADFTTEELKTEEWRPVPGYESLYSVSNLGRVRRDLAVPGCRAGRILASAKDDYGYPRACLSKNGQHRTYKVHHLVAETFIGPRPQGLTVNHIDGCKTNNRPDNLEYCTFRENSEHATALGLMHSGEEHATLCRRIALRGERNHKTKLTEQQVREIREKAAMRRFTHRELAAQYGISRSTLQQIIYRKNWTHI